MSYLGSLAKKLGDMITETIGGKLTAAICAAVVAVLTAGWVWLYNRMNPEFIYEATPSSSASHFVGLANVLKQIDKDSHVYCSGGWDQRIASFALRQCYDLTFVPQIAYSTYVCSLDPTGLKVSTSDQLVALRRIEKKYEGCFSISQGNSEHSYTVRPGPRSVARTVQFGAATADKSYFCGCSSVHEQEIAKTIGATMR
jgi:hypothetical protein